MPYVNVRVVDEDDNPISGEKVTIFITHTFLPQTQFEDYTDDEGRAYFDFESGISVDVYVRGERVLEGVGLDSEVTVSV